MSAPLDTDPAPTPKSTHGGARPGAGAPPGPRPATVERLERLREYANLAAHGEDVSALSNLDIVQIHIWRLWNEGRRTEAAQFAGRLLPYQHTRKPTVSVVRTEEPGAATDDAPEPIPPPPPPRAEPPPRRSVADLARELRIAALPETDPQSPGGPDPLRDFRRETVTIELTPRRPR